MRVGRSRIMYYGIISSFRCARQWFDAPRPTSSDLCEIRAVKARATCYVASLREQGLLLERTGRTPRWCDIDRIRPRLLLLPPSRRSKMFVPDRARGDFRELRLGLDSRVTFAIPGGPGAEVFVA